LIKIGEQKTSNINVRGFLFKRYLNNTSSEKL
jgi:hypothetical protein